jgi:hypothetical protein
MPRCRQSHLSAFEGAGRRPAQGVYDAIHAEAERARIQSAAARGSAQRGVPAAAADSVGPAGAVGVTNRQ